MPDAPLQDFLAALRADDDSVLVPIHASPGASREGLAGLHGGALRITTTAPADKGAATRRIGRLLAAALGVAPGRVACVGGSASRRKIYAARGLDLDAARRRLAKALA